MVSSPLKTNQILSPIRKWAWLFILLVAFGGLWYPRFGLLIIPVMVILTFLSFFTGKFWCGNLCPHGSFFDSILSTLSPKRKIAGFFKSKITIAIAFTWFMAMIVIRLIKVFSIWGAFNFYDKLGTVFVMNYLMVTIIGSLLALLVSPRTWCSICPMGTMQLLMYKLGKTVKLNKKTDKKISITDQAKCYSCAKCSRVCPMQLTPHLEFTLKNQFDDEKCIRCSFCVYNCPAGILRLKTDKTGRFSHSNSC